MNKVMVTIKLFSYWHAGTGLGRGGDIDAIVARDSRGWPYLPGKTVKGLFREAVRLAEQCGPLLAGTTVLLFGRRSDGQNPNGTSKGALLFSDAFLALDASSRKTLVGETSLKADLFDGVSSTALKDGVAMTETLRTIEVTVPVVLETVIEGPLSGPASDWKKVLTTAAPLIRQLGSHRHRGLGRCKVEVHQS